MKTINELREDISSAIADLRAKRINAEHANAYCKLVNAFIATLRLEFDYRRCLEPGAEKAGPFIQAEASAGSKSILAVESPQTSLSLECIEGGETLHGTFTLTDVQARAETQQQAGMWLALWKSKGWIETVGPMSYRKTNKFPTTNKT